MRVPPGVTEPATIQVRKWNSGALAAQLQTSRLVDQANASTTRRRKPRQIVKLRKIVIATNRQRVLDQTSPAPKGKR